MEMYPSVSEGVLAFFNTKNMHTGFGVEFFFIIGGFFLYKRILSTSDSFGLIKQIYIRLMPALLFTFLMCFIFGSTNHLLYGSKFPLVLSLTSGMGLPGEATGWGCWYVGVYFWCSLLYIGLFCAYPKRAFLWVGILMYFTLHLKFFAPYPGWMKSYYTIIGSELIRGIYSMGLGIVTAFLSNKISFANTKGMRIFFTIAEICCFIFMFNYIARASHSYFTFWEIELIFAMFVICMAHSFGYLSALFNSFSKIKVISRYTYSIFLCHIIIFSILWSHNHFALPGGTCTVIIFVGAVLLGVMEYHLIEQRFVPWLKNYFKNSSAQN